MCDCGTGLTVFVTPRANGADGAVFTYTAENVAEDPIAQAGMTLSSVVSVHVLDVMGRR